MREFINDEKGYFKWIEDNPKGFVVNTNIGREKNYLMLHKATCSFISSHNIGNYTTNYYIKECSSDLDELEKWARKQVGKLNYCGMCFRDKKTKTKMVEKKKIRIKSTKKLTALKCPSCKEILKERPPCECEYCGAKIEII